MQACLSDQFFQCVLCYLDDILVYSKSFEEHLTNLSLVFDRLRKFGLKIKPSKCELFKPEVKYLGHIVTRDGVMTDPGKVDAVKKWPTPKDVKELRSYLGFCSFYRRFVPGFSKIAGPLHALVANCLKERKNNQRAAFTWQTEHQQAFDTLKSKLCSRPILAYADFKLPFEVEIDASFLGLGAVLSQDPKRKEMCYSLCKQDLAWTRTQHGEVLQYET
ncbi:Retrovirus polyprotein [Apostichopus japonicus]|uniref:Retrovirus polyprotein n=1 Tax=Stichopus japonicus TaxID=307972 RepID=A0A2G8JKF4_STIJA|nr:Retrovirus polyprotein [Apostichopus japonicus]